MITTFFWDDNCRFLSKNGILSQALPQSGKQTITPHLIGKKLPTNSPWNFEYVFETMDNYWVGQDEHFCPESTPTRWRCYHFSKNRLKSKFDATLSIKKPFVTPKFCGRNFSQMHHNYLLLYSKYKKSRGDKKFIFSKWCIWEQFRPQTLGVTKGFFILKVVSDFDFDHFLEKW